MVIPRHRHYATPGRGACHVGVFEYIGATIYPRTFAVPNTKHTVVLISTRWRKTELLSTPNRRSRQLFIHTRLKRHVMCLEVLFCLLQRLVIRSQG